uniref:USP domain-containing protein n=1 Tax=Setaria digitata TaxID=48799 RepID=A0A915PWG5_9BILA
MTVAVQHDQFNVKVLYGSKNSVPIRKVGVLMIDETKQEMIFLCDDSRLVTPFKALLCFPYLTPGENSLGFWIEGNEKTAFLMEFENHEDLKEVHEALKKWLDDSQLSMQNSPKRGREFEDQIKHNEKHRTSDLVDIESIKKYLNQFTLDSVQEPTAKRSRLSSSTDDFEADDIEIGDSSMQSGNSSINDDDSLDRFYEEILECGGGKADFSIIGSEVDVVFAKDLYKFCKVIEGLGLNLNIEMPLSLAVANLASRRHRATNQLKITLLRIIRNIAHFGSSAQQDAHEFLINILNQMQEECDTMLHKLYGIEDKEERGKRNPVTSNFAFVMESIIRCKKCDVVTKNKEESIILPVSIHMLEQAGSRSKRPSQFLTVQTLLDEYLKVEDVDKKCEICGFVGATKKQKFAQIPRCLIVFIKRYIFDSSTAVKRFDRVQIPLHLTLNKAYVEEAAPYPALSPAIKDIDFKTTRLLKINLFRDIANFNYSSTDTERAFELSEGNGARFISAAFIPRIIDIERWGTFNMHNETVRQRSFISQGNCGSGRNIYVRPETNKILPSAHVKPSKLVSSTKVSDNNKESDDALLRPMPTTNGSILDHDYIQSELYDTSSESSRRDLGEARVCFTEALKNAGSSGDKKKESVNFESLLSGQCNGNTDAVNGSNASVVKLTRTDNPNNAVPSKMIHLASVAVSKGTGSRVKEFGDVNENERVLTVPCKSFGERGGSTEFGKRFHEYIDDREESEGFSAAHLTVSSPEFSRYDQKYFSNLRSKINILTPDSKQPFQPDSVLKMKQSSPSPEHTMFHSLLAQRQLNLSRLQKPPSKGDYTDEDLHFMTEEEQILAACERSLADQLNSFQKGNGGSSKKVSQGAGEKVLREQKDTDKPVGQKSASSDIDEEHKIDTKMVDGQENCSEKFKKSEHCTYKPKIQKSPSHLPDKQLVVEAETVGETETCSNELKKLECAEYSPYCTADRKLEENIGMIGKIEHSVEFKKQEGKECTDKLISQELPGSAIEEKFEMNTEVVREAENQPDEFKKHEDEHSTYKMTSQKSSSVVVDKNFEVVVVEKVKEVENSSEGSNIQEYEPGNWKDSKDESVQKISKCDCEDKIETKQGELLMKTEKVGKLLEEYHGDLGSEIARDISESKIPKEVNEGNANEKTLKSKNSDKNNHRAENMDMNRASESSKKVTLNSDVIINNDLSGSKSGNQDIEKSKVINDSKSLNNVELILDNMNNTEGKGGARRKTYLKKDRPPTPPELSFRTDQVITYRGGWTSTRSKDPLLGFKQTMVAAKAEFLNRNFEIGNTGELDKRRLSPSDICVDLSISRDPVFSSENECFRQAAPPRCCERGLQSLVSIIGFETEHPGEFAALKGWTNDRWICHVDLLTKTGLGTELELYAFAAMFCVDVWVFHKKQWLCYKPNFLTIDNRYGRLSIGNYRTGENEGVYLLYEHKLFAPVLTPSDKKDYIGKVEPLSSDARANEDAAGPSYRLISVVSHLGQSVNSGHYICDVWCDNSKGWFLCNDQLVRSVDEISVRSRCSSGYIYFYLNRSETIKFGLKLAYYMIVTVCG